jgi:hypothetical protein
MGGEFAALTVADVLADALQGVAGDALRGLFEQPERLGGCQAGRRLRQGIEGGRERRRAHGECGTALSALSPANQGSEAEVLVEFEPAAERGLLLLRL